jgi:hypothetical protein
MYACFTKPLNKEELPRSVEKSILVYKKIFLITEHHIPCHS